MYKLVFDIILLFEKVVYSYFSQFIPTLTDPPKDCQQIIDKSILKTEILLINSHICSRYMGYLQIIDLNVYTSHYRFNI